MTIINLFIQISLMKFKFI